MNMYGFLFDLLSKVGTYVSVLIYDPAT